MSLKKSEAAKYLSFIETVCRDAGKVLMRHFRNLDDYEKKGDIDLVTIADKESEAVILEAIKVNYPGHGILAEESGAGGEAHSEYLWVIDPLDGTTNYAHGMRNFAISIGLQHSGDTIAGGVFGPALDEMFLAAKGNGATLNGKPMSVSAISKLNEALLVTGFPYNRREAIDWLMGTMGEFVQRSQGMLRLGAAALDLAYVANGTLEGFYEANLHPWDMAAGALLVEEAGGRMSQFDGSPFTIQSKRMLASNGQVHDEMMRVLSMRPFPDDKIMAS